jgi:hypothetical protein
MDNKDRPVRFNHIRLSFDALALPGVVGLAYERKLGRKFSLSLAGYTPLLNASIDNKSINFSGFGLQPEVRVYLGKNAMRGWYFGLYYIHLDYTLKAKGIQNFTIVSDNNSESVPFDSEVTIPIKHDGVGISMGPQFLIGSRISLGFQFACSIGTTFIQNPMEGDAVGTGIYDKANKFQGKTPNTQYPNSDDGTIKYQGTTTFSPDDNVAHFVGNGTIKTLDLPNIYPKFGFSLGYLFGK